MVGVVVRGGAAVRRGALVGVVPRADEQHVADDQPAAVGAPRGLEDHRAGQVAPRGGDHRVRRAEPERAGVAVQQRAEHARAVVAGQAHPLDRAVTAPRARTSRSPRGSRSPRSAGRARRAGGSRCPATLPPDAREFARAGALAALGELPEASPLGDAPTRRRREPRAGRPCPRSARRPDRRASRPRGRPSPQALGGASRGRGPATSLMNLSAARGGIRSVRLTCAGAWPACSASATATRVAQPADHVVDQAGDALALLAQLEQQLDRGLLVARDERVGERPDLALGARWRRTPRPPRRRSRRPGRARARASRARAAGAAGARRPARRAPWRPRGRGRS